MPEQMSKYPEVTIQVLKGAGARCGEGAEQKILMRCPRGDPADDADHQQKLAGIVCPPELQSSMGSVLLSSPEIVLLGVIFAAGAAVGGRFWRTINSWKNRDSM